MKAVLIVLFVSSLLGVVAHQDADRADPRPVQVFQIDELMERHAEGGRSYTGFLRVPALHAGIYTLSAGAADGQSPHREDEVYYVLAGRGKLRSGDAEHAVRAGSVIYVKAGEDHRFTEIAEDLELLVLFSTAPSDPPKKERDGR